MIPHPMTEIAVQESRRQQLLTWVERDRRASSALDRVTSGATIAKPHVSASALASARAAVFKAVAALSQLINPAHGMERPADPFPSP